MRDQEISEVERVAAERTLGVLSEVAQERIRQRIKWGLQHLADGTGESVIWNGFTGPAKEQADAARARTQAGEDKGSRETWADVLFEEAWEAAAESDPVLLRKELIQVAAVAVQWIEDLDSNPRTSPEVATLTKQMKYMEACLDGSTPRIESST